MENDKHSCPGEPHSAREITETILALETHALELWNAGNPDGYLELSSDDVIYFDPAIPEKFVGKKALAEFYEGFRGKNDIDSYEMIEPVVQVLSPGSAVLGFDYEGRKGDNVYRMHCTEVYKLDKAGVWKIVNTHWSFVITLDS